MNYIENQEEFEDDNNFDDATGIEWDVDEPNKKIQVPFDPTKVLFSTQQQSLQLLLDKIKDKELLLLLDHLLKQILKN